MIERNLLLFVSGTEPEEINNKGRELVGYEVEQNEWRNKYRRPKTEYLENRSHNGFAKKIKRLKALSNPTWGNINNQK